MMAGLVRTDFDKLSGWAEHDHEAAFAAFSHAASFLLNYPPKIRNTAVDVECLLDVAQKALAIPDALSCSEAKDFFEYHFAPFALDENGLMTGYYEPEFDARLSSDETYRYPLHRRPPDLIGLNTDEALAAGFTEETSFARKLNGKIQFHLSRGEVMAGGLDGQELELAWLKDPFDAYIIHIQGSARLRLEDGTTIRITFDGKSGHPYQSLGKLLIEEGHFTPDTITMDGLIAHLRAMGDEGYQTLARNPSYIFFKQVEEDTLTRSDVGPIAAAQIPLIAHRSIAVDRHLHTFGLPFWIETKLPLINGQGEVPFEQLVFAHDTGSAIKGLARADLFCGTGEDAGRLAGMLQQRTHFTCLLPIKPDAKREARNA